MHSPTLTSLPLLSQGKVRDNYDLGHGLMLMVASDRISAFDVVMQEPILGKGQLLTKMALYWFEQLQSICPNHLTGLDPSSFVAPHERPLIEGRSMVVKRLQPIPIEAVVRGYLAGSGWQSYQIDQTVCHQTLPAGLTESMRLPEPIFTPATKAAAGEHDENISFEQACVHIGKPLAEKIRSISLELYAKASEKALKSGIIIADTKFEFGLDENQQVVLMDEVLTPDSSRYWPLETYQAGSSQPSFDKQYLRNWLEAATLNGEPWNKTPPPPPLPSEVIHQTQQRYAEACQRLGI